MYAERREDIFQSIASDQHTRLQCKYIYETVKSNQQTVHKTKVVITSIIVVYWTLTLFALNSKKQTKIMIKKEIKY